jgi:hypothetical protein
MVFVVFSLFFIALSLFSIILLEREVMPHMEIYFYGMNGWYNANFQCRSIAREKWSAHES